MVVGLVAGLVAVVVPFLSTTASAAARGVDSTGADPVGSAAYPLPTGAVYVSPSGSDSNPGSLASPVRTLAHALSVAPTSGTVVMRGGNYHEYVIVSKPVTIQNYPGEATWMDGSVEVSGWVRDGSWWRHDGWTTRFDHSPTYTKGAPDSTNPYWQFVNPQTAPMAAHPDQVWVGNQPLKQMPSLSAMGPGRFYLNEATSQLYIGSDPGGGVRASTIAQAMSARAGNVTLRGIGFRRYAPSVYMLAAIVLEQPNALLEDVRVSEMATTGISVLNSGSTLRRVTVDASGMLGIHARFADGITFDQVLSTGNNSEGFNLAPVSGGAKLGQTRGITVRDSSFSGNYGHGFWEDMSDYNTVVRGSDFNHNSGNGLFLEISARAVVGDSMFLGNNLDGMKVNNTSNVSLWNNTLVGNGRPLDLVQDARRNSNPSDPAVDPRIRWPDPEMPWQLDSVTVADNVVGPPNANANCLLCVEDYSHQETAAQMKISANGNVYNRQSASAPTWLTVWSAGAGNPNVYTTLAAFKAATGQEARSREYTGSTVVLGSGDLDSAVQDIAPSIALGLPGTVAGAIGRSSGAVHLGAWNDDPGAGSPAPTTAPPSPPATGATLARDDFKRTVSGGWGSADMGGAWSIPDGASFFSVRNWAGQVKLTPGDGYTALLRSVSSANTDLSLAINVNSLAGSTGHWIDLIGRDVTGQGRYAAQLELANDGKLNVWLVKDVNGTRTSFASGTVSGLAFNPANTLRARLQVTGTGPTNMRVKVWSDGATEPATWALSASDATSGLQQAGNPGIYAYTGGSVSAGPVVVSVGDLLVTNGG
jgi:hypothetical protein